MSSLIQVRLLGTLAIGAPISQCRQGSAVELLSAIAPSHAPEPPTPEVPYYPRETPEPAQPFYAKFVKRKGRR